jgi:pimeloyl-ACP methyl ester carboxylesterase
MALTTFVDGRLWGARYGTAAPWLLALHGWGRDHRDFDPLLTGESSALDAIALDLPGHGAAAEPPEPWTTAIYAEWIAPVLEEMDGPVVVLGHSFGGRVAVRLAEIRPERIGALVITGTPLAPVPGGPRSGPPIVYRSVRAMHRAGLLSEERMEGFRRRYGSEDYRRATPTMRGVLVGAVKETSSGAYLPSLSAYPGPLELVWGDDDDQAPPAALESVSAVRPDARVTRLRGVGHFTPRDAPADLRAAVWRHRRADTVAAADPGPGEQRP